MSYPSTNLIFTSKKFIVSFEYSAVNFIVGWKLFNLFRIFSEILLHVPKFPDSSPPYHRSPQKHWEFFLQVSFFFNGQNSMWRCKLCSNCSSTYLSKSFFIELKNVVFQHYFSQFLSYKGLRQMGLISVQWDSKSETGQGISD